MIEEKSCGAIVYHQLADQPKYLLIQHENGGHWSFPKGHVEELETEEETALREIVEETGLEVTLDTGFRQENRYSPKPGVMKDVIYFIAESPQEGVVNQEDEVTNYQWLSYAEARSQLTYDTDRELLDTAQAYLDHSVS